MVTRVAGFLWRNGQELVLGNELEAVRRIATGDFKIDEKICDAERVRHKYCASSAVLFGQIEGWIYFLAVLPQEAGAGTAERVDHGARRCVAAVVALGFRAIEQTLIIQNAQPGFDVGGVAAIERDQVVGI